MTHHDYETTESSFSSAEGFLDAARTTAVAARFAAMPDPVKLMTEDQAAGRVGREVG